MRLSKYGHQVTPRQRHGLLAVNAAGALAGTAFAVVGVRRPAYIGDDTPVQLARFWAQSSAVRTWSVTALLLGGLAGRSSAAPELLVAAGLIQLGDSALGIRRRDPAMALAPLVMGVAHLASARALSRKS